MQARDTSARIWTSDQFRAEFGRPLDVSRDAVAFMNSDGEAVSAHTQGATAIGGDVYVTFDRAVNGPVRVGYIVALGG